MSRPDWNDDDALMRAVAGVLRPDPTEELVLRAAGAVRHWRSADPDLELATLLRDSAVDAGAAVRDGGSCAPHGLVYGVGGRQVEVEVGADGIVGQLVPPEPGTVRLVRVSGEVEETRADEVGCFAFDGRHGGAVRLECTTSAGRFVTEWIGTT